MKLLSILVSTMILFGLSACTQLSTETDLGLQKFGTPEIDYSKAVAAHPQGTGAVVAGMTTGSLDGLNKGYIDAFIRKYDSNLVWGRQFGTTSADDASDLAMTRSGISYVLGTTYGSLATSKGNQDVFFRKYSATGSAVWTKQFGSTSYDYSLDMVATGNFIYTLTQEGDANFTIRKWDANGNLLKTIKERNSQLNSAFAISVDSFGTIYVLTQYLNGLKQVAGLISYSSAGIFQALKPIYTPIDTVIPNDLIIDSHDNLYLSVTDTAAGKGAYLRKLTNTGLTLWSRHLEPSSLNSFSPSSLAIDSSDNVYVAGEVNLSNYQGFKNAGYRDIAVLKYETTGKRAWVRQIGANMNDFVNGIAVSDAVYVTGYSYSDPNLAGNVPYGTPDPYLLQLDKVSGALKAIDQ